MTKQDIDDIIRTICPNDEDFEKPCISPAYLKKELEALALEQEPILDKIRAEIEQKARPYEIGGRGNGKSIRYGLFMALEIINKYKAGSEDKE